MQVPVSEVIQGPTQSRRNEAKMICTNTSSWNEKIAEESLLILLFFKAKHAEPKSNENCFTVTEDDQ